MLSDERIRKILDECDEGQEPSEYILAFARDIEREATAPLIERISLLERKLALVQQGKFDERMYQAGIEQEKQIKEDEELMRRVLDALLETPRYPGSTPNQLGAIDALRQRLEAKK